MISRSALVKATAARRRRHNRLIQKHLTPQERLLARHRQVQLANDREYAACLAAEASDGVERPRDGDSGSIDDALRPWRSVAEQINIDELADEVSEDVGPPTATPDSTVRGSNRR